MESTGKRKNSREDATPEAEKSTDKIMIRINSRRLSGLSQEGNGSKTNTQSVKNSQSPKKAKSRKGDKIKGGKKGNEDNGPAKLPGEIGLLEDDELRRPVTPTYKLKEDQFMDLNQWLHNKDTFLQGLQFGAIKIIPKFTIINEAILQRVHQVFNDNCPINHAKIGPRSVEDSTIQLIPDPKSEIEGSIDAFLDCQLEYLQRQSDEVQELFPKSLRDTLPPHKVSIWEKLKDFEVYYTAATCEKLTEVFKATLERGNLPGIVHLVEGSVVDAPTGNPGSWSWTDIMNNHADDVVTLDQEDLDKMKGDTKFTLKSPLSPPRMMKGSIGSVVPMGVGLAGAITLHLLVWGAPRIWLSVRGEDNERLHEWLQEVYPDDSKACPHFINHLDIFILTSALREKGIRYAYTLQRPGEVVATFPMKFSQGINLGPNLVESKFLLGDAWVRRSPLIKLCHCDVENIDSAHIKQFYLRQGMDVDHNWEDWDDNIDDFNNKEES